MDHTAPITWDDIAGLEFVKKTIKEIVIWPMLRPDIFNGLRGPPKGLLLFGPPGTGNYASILCSLNDTPFYLFFTYCLGKTLIGIINLIDVLDLFLTKISNLFLHLIKLNASQTNLNQSFST